MSSEPTGGESVERPRTPADRFRHALRATVAEVLPELAASLERAFDQVMAEAAAPPEPPRQLECPSCDDAAASHAAGFHEEGPDGLVNPLRSAAPVGLPLTPVEEIMLNAIRYRAQEPDTAYAVVKEDVRWLLSRIDRLGSGVSPSATESEEQPDDR